MTHNQLSQNFVDNHPQDAARVLEQFEPADISDYLVQISVPSAANVLRHIPPTITVACLVIMERSNAARIIEQFSIERASSLLRRMQADVRTELIKSMSHLYANMIRLVMKYPDGTVGQVMNPNVFTVHQDMHTGDVIAAARDSSDQVRSEVYVIDTIQRLVGIIYIRDLFTVEATTPLSKIFRPSDTVISARSRLSHVQHNTEWKYRDNLPVVDRNGKFIGILKRGVMLDTLARTGDSLQQQDGFTETVLAMAELFWETCLDLFTPQFETNEKRYRDE